MNRITGWFRWHLTVSASWVSVAIALTFAPADGRASALARFDRDVFSACHGAGGQRIAQDLGNDKIPGGVENTPSAGGAMPPPAAMPAPPPMMRSPAPPHQTEPLQEKLDKAKDKKSRGNTQGKDKDKKSGSNDASLKDDTASQNTSKSSTPALHQVPASAPPATRGLTRGLTMPKPPDGGDEGQPGGVELMPSHE